MKSKAKNTLKTLAVASALILFIQTPSAFATSLSDLKEEKKQVETKKNQLNSSISNKSNAITANQEKQQQILDQIQALNAEIDKTNSNIKKYKQIFGQQMRKLKVRSVYRGAFA